MLVPVLLFCIYCNSQNQQKSIEIEKHSRGNTQFCFTEDFQKNYVFFGLLERGRKGGDNKFD